MSYIEAFIIGLIISGIGLNEIFSDPSFGLFLATVGGVVSGLSLLLFLRSNRKLTEEEMKQIQETIERKLEELRNQQIAELEELRSQQMKELEKMVKLEELRSQQMAKKAELAEIVQEQESKLEDMAQLEESKLVEMAKLEEIARLEKIEHAKEIARLAEIDASWWTFGLGIAITLISGIILYKVVIYLKKKK